MHYCRWDEWRRSVYWKQLRLFQKCNGNSNLKKNESIFMNFNLIKVTKITKWKCPRERDGMLVTNLVVSILKKCQSNQIETNAILLAKEIVQNECGECLKVNFLHWTTKKCIKCFTRVCALSELLIWYALGTRIVTLRSGDKLIHSQCLVHRTNF